MAVILLKFTKLSPSDAVFYHTEEQATGSGVEKTTTLPEICRICHSSAEESGRPLMTPCRCAGSIKFVHQECLSRWIITKNIKECELCKHTFRMEYNMAPITIREWKNPSTRRALAGLIGLIFLAILLAGITAGMVALQWNAGNSLVNSMAKGTLVDASEYTRLALTIIFGFIASFFTFVLYKICMWYVSVYKKWKKSNIIIVVQEVSHA